MENGNSAGKALSLLLLLIGIAGVITALILDFTGSKLSFRGPLLIIGLIIFFVGLYLFPTKKHHRTIINIIFLFPLLFCFVITVIIPFGLGLFYSTTDWNGIRMTEFVGADNYVKMFSEKEFLWSLILTVLFVIVNMILVNVIGLALAVLCTSKIRAVGFFRAAYFIPNLIGGIVLGYIWQFIFNNVVLKWTYEAFAYNSSMLSKYNTGFIAIILVYIWQYAGYIMMIYITGLTTVSTDVIEAAAIDGANAVQTFFQIKLPMIASTITVCTFLTLQSAFKQFDVNMALTNGTGSVTFLGKYLSNGTQMLALNIYNTAITKNNYAMGQAKAVLFFVILSIVSIIQVSISNKREVEM